MLHDRVDFFEVQPERIGASVAFEIENRLGEKDTFLIEEEPNLRLTDEAISSTHEIALAANGLKVGDTFAINLQKERKDEWTIKWIKHKYIYALHRSMDKFERQFPSADGLERVFIDQSSENPLEPILTRVKKQHDAIQAAFDTYDTKPIPLKALAQGLGAQQLSSAPADKRTFLGLATMFPFGQRGGIDNHAICVRLEP